MTPTSRRLGRSRGSTYKVVMVAITHGPRRAVQLPFRALELARSVPMECRRVDARFFDRNPPLFFRAQRDGHRLPRCAAFETRKLMFDCITYKKRPASPLAGGSGGETLELTAVNGERRDDEPRSALCALHCAGLVAFRKPRRN